MTAVRYSVAVWKEGLTCGMVYSEPWLREPFTEFVHPSNLYSMRTYRGAHREATLYTLGRHGKT